MPRCISFPFSITPTVWSLFESLPLATADQRASPVERHRFANWLRHFRRRISRIHSPDQRVRHWFDRNNLVASRHSEKTRCLTRCENQHSHAESLHRHHRIKSTARKRAANSLRANARGCAVPGIRMVAICAAGESCACCIAAGKRGRSGATASDRHRQRYRALRRCWIRDPARSADFFRARA